MVVVKFNSLPVRMAKSEQQKLKERLDRVFSQYIRLRDSKRGYCKCITCGDVRFWKDKMHCGHYISRGILITRFDENNCNAQCESCNLWKDKNEMQLSYRENLCKKIGDGFVRALEQIRHKVFKVDENWYREKIEYYQKKVNKMLKKL